MGLARLATKACSAASTSDRLPFAALPPHAILTAPPPVSPLASQRSRSHSKNALPRMVQQERDQTVTTPTIVSTSAVRAMASRTGVTS